MWLIWGDDLVEACQDCSRRSLQPRREDLLSATWRTSSQGSGDATVAAALELKKIGLWFIGVVKTATRRFPMAYLQGLELQKRGNRKGLTMRGNTSLCAFVWMDCDCRYFIASASSLQEGASYNRL
jgi:hypothetical protein